LTSAICQQRFRELANGRVAFRRWHSKPHDSVWRDRQSDRRWFGRLSGITSAITACPAGEVVQLAAGTFIIAEGNYVALNKGITLRDAGPGSTKRLAYPRVPDPDAPPIRPARP